MFGVAPEGPRASASIHRCPDQVTFERICLRASAQYLLGSTSSRVLVTPLLTAFKPEAADIGRNS